ncbi:N-acetyltransferase [Rhodohalobacter sp.]|uniref:GNAT family N-acetyltransferase n=1 Tax=Rhodohalobacter sp. TaxID=1974210 RepID=UPI002ACE0441|nr:N-acetyltransferase [Rhodohalobacter sp.]
MNIRQSTPKDNPAIRNLHLSAFPKEEREVVAKLAADLISEPTEPETLSLVAETDGGDLAGHVVFSPVRINNHDEIAGYILAPLGVSPEHQNQGVGSALIKQGLEWLASKGVHLVFVYGDPAYYGRYGFDAGTAVNYQPKFEMEFPFGWQALVLNPKGEEGPDQPVTITFVPALQDPGLW